MLKTNTFLKTTFVLALFIVPMVSFAGDAGDYGSGGWDGSYSTGWGDGTYGYDYDYTPNYSDTYSTGWGDGTYGYDYDYTPNYGGYSSPSYGGYSAPSYTGSTIGGYSYRPSGSSYYTTPSYSGSSIPSTAYSGSNSNADANSNANAKNDVKVITTATGGNANAVASSSNVNVNNNVNNVYVYTNPSGNAVIHNPEYQRLDGYCVVTPNTARIGQTVTATAYITGGIGNYTYTWGGDLATQASGVSTTFTSYNPGTKNVTVTARSGQDVITKNCTVTFENSAVSYNSYNYGYTGGYTSTVTSGTPVSGVFLQPGQISTGRPVSGVYLNDLPATGMDLGVMEYTIGFMVIVLAAVMVVISKAKKSFVNSTNR